MKVRPWLMPVCVCAALNAAVFAAVAWSHPAYLRDYRLNPNPDAVHYVLLGHNLFQHGVYSRSAAAPFVPDIFRTPLYPLFAGGLDLVGGPWLIYAAQMLMHCWLCAVVAALAGRMFGPRAALAAGLFIAVHPTLLVLNVQAMSETPFLLLTAFGALAAIRAADGPGLRVGRCLAAGLALGAAILVRPAGLYLPALIAIWLVVVSIRPQGSIRAAGRGLAFTAGVAAFVVPWVARNAATFGLPVLTTNDTVVLVYFTGAGAYQLHHGVDRATAWAMIAKEFDLNSAEEMWNYHSRGLDPAEMDRSARSAIRPVLTRYPAALMKSSVFGLAKSILSHDATLWAAIMDLRWDNPGFGGLARLEGTAWRTLSDNPPPVTAMAAAQLLANLLVFPLAIIGVPIAARHGSRGAGLLLLLFAFFALVCAASGVDAYTRFGAPMLPFAATFAGVAVAGRFVKGRFAVSAAAVAEPAAAQ